MGAIPNSTRIIPKVIICFEITFARFACLIINKSIITPVINADIIPIIAASGAGKPRLINTTVATNALNIPIDPWAKFVARDVLKIMIIPRVAKAKILPVSRPLKIKCKISLIYNKTSCVPSKTTSSFFESVFKKN